MLVGTEVIGKGTTYQTLIHPLSRPGAQRRRGLAIKLTTDFVFGYGEVKVINLKLTEKCKLPKHSAIESRQIRKEAMEFSHLLFCYFFADKQMYMCICISIYLHIYTYIRIYVCVFVSVGVMYICMCV